MADLKGFLFEKHKSFLSNPLLLSIMLLTYGYSADIPNKLSIFYNQAFEALFQRHDALKGAYKRIRETDLDIQEFGRILSIFCIQTFDDRKIQFSRDEALNYIEKAKELVGIEFKSEYFLSDLLQSVCLLIEDGLFITFSHRSFQEYFAARFIVASDIKIKKRLLSKYQTTISEDNIFKLVHELDREYLEYEIIYPFLEKLLNDIGIKQKVGITHFFKFVKLMWSKFEFRPYGLFGSVNTHMNINATVRFVIFNLNNNVKLDNYFKGVDTPWISEQLSIVKENNKPITIKVDELKLKDTIIKELFISGRYFSKKTLELLVKIKTDLENKKKTTSEKLEEFLFSKK